MYKMLEDMTDEEVGALVKASKRGEVIQVGYFVGTDEEYWKGIAWPNWDLETYYRIKPKPTVEIVELFGKKMNGEWGFSTGKPWPKDTHKITLTIRDGVVDAVAKVEKSEENDVSIMR